MPKKSDGKVFNFKGKEKEVYRSVLKKRGDVIYRFRCPLGLWEIKELPARSAFGVGSSQAGVRPSAAKADKNMTQDEQN